MDTPSDEQLLDAYFNGEADGFRLFYRRHSGRVIGYAVSKGLSQELAIDTCQEAFLKLHRFIHKYEKGRPALPWFFTIVHRCVMDALRHQQHTTKLSSTLVDQSAMLLPEADFIHEPFSLRSGETTLALAKLSPEQESIVRMHAVEDLSFRDIAKVTGKSEVALRKIYERAKAKLRSFMVKDHPHGP
jgi:RNA polymerase sigma-70 factor (ECF subfamily)